ncbi:DUF2612 domain-containing protein [Pseudomonas nitroreducens]|uniref:DUF2612 domain-containing protein n=1 Tax=Pseudomonas nitroreducens TaxID=46680 RepID=A0A6G6IY30_PSENT|nr:DUF2612 domain-containing protein [Pseudomonas nitroreducens]QIE87969.1 DUF2612 domain-containing protein [Pseudomonas nitroreducens]
MADISNYIGLITTEHSDKPKFMAMVEAVVQPMVDALNASQGLPADFDLDLAIGAQLDVVGLWVGISRNVNAPLSGVYFSLDVVGLGFDQGAWKGPFDPDTGIISLDDETYRILIRAKIGANRWDGTLGQSKQILDLIFSGDTHVFIEDRQDMSILLGISGEIPSAVFLALLTGGYIPIKPEGVRMSVYVVTSVSGAPIFGFDMNNEYVAGFDVGAWGGNPDNVVYPQPLAFEFTSGPLDSLITFSRTDVGTRFNASGVLETVAANLPRFDYDPVSLQPRGMLIEEQRANLILQSANLADAAWTKSNVTVTAGAALAPDGTMTAGKVIGASGSSGSRFIASTAGNVSNVVVTGSIFIKAAEYSKLRLNLSNFATDSRGVYIDVATASIYQTDTNGPDFSNISGSVVNCGNGWYRCTVTAMKGTANTVVRLALDPKDNSGASAGDGTSGFYAWGGQLEIGNGVTSLIPTTSSQSVRAPDIAFVPISTWFNNLEGTVQAKYQAQVPAQTNRVASLFSSVGQMIAIDSNGQCEVDGTFVSPPSVGGNAAVAFKAGDAAAAVAGAITGAGTPALPDFPKALYLGSLDGQSQFLNGWLKQLTYQPSRLGNSDLIALTT